MLVGLLVIVGVSGLGVVPVQGELLVVIDTDVAPDDIGAMLYLLKNPQVRVLAITVSCGVCYVDAGVETVLRLLDYVGVRDVPVAAGNESPLVTNHTFPADWRTGSLNGYGLDLPTTDLQPSDLNASELMIAVINSAPVNVTIITLGPLTNVAMALQAEPSIRARIDGLTIMGGAVNVAGNVGFEYPPIPNFVAEWNMYIDPHAADIVFKSGIPIRLIPLDATNEVPQTEAFYDTLASVMRTPEAEIVHQLMSPGMYFWDQLTAVSVTNPSVVTFGFYSLVVVIDSQNQSGWTQSVGGPQNAQAAEHADAKEFERVFIEIINSEEPTHPPPIHPGVVTVALVIVAAGLIGLGFLYWHRRVQS